MANEGARISGWSLRTFPRTFGSWCTSTATGSFRGPTDDLTSAQFDGTLPNVQVVWEADDLSLFTPASAPLLTPSTLTVSQITKQTGGASPGRSGPSPAESQNEKGGLSTGAQAGIGVGVALAALILLACLILLVLRRRRNNRKPPPSHEPSEKPYLDSKAELPESVASKQAGQKPAELPDKEPQEMRADKPAGSELEAQSSKQPPPIPFASKPRFDVASSGERHELQGDFLGHEASDARSPTWRRICARNMYV